MFQRRKLTHEQELARQEWQIVTNYIESLLEASVQYSKHDELESELLKLFENIASLNEDQLSLLKASLNQKVDPVIDYFINIAEGERQATTPAFR